MLRQIQSPVMRRIQSLTATAALSLITLALLAFLPLLGLPTAHASPPRQAPAASPCTVAADKAASPGVIGLGEIAHVNFTMRFTCPDARAIHLVMVLDASNSMQGDPSRRMKDAMRLMVDQLQMASHPEVKVGVVGFASGALTMCQLTNSAEQAKSCIGRVGTSGGSCIDCGVREGLRVLLNGRRTTPAQARDFVEVMLIVSNGANVGGCDPVAQAVRQVKAQGVLVATVCVSGACDSQCMHATASSARYFFQLDSPAQLTAVIDRLLTGDGPSMIFKRITIADTLPANMPLVPGSAVPAPSQAAGNQLTWEWRLIPAGFVSATFQVRPQALGQWPANVQATGDFVDHLGRTGVLTFTIPSILVGQATSTVTPTPLPATITPTPGPTSAVHPTLVRPTHPPPPGPTPTPTHPLPQLCPGLAARVPAAAISQAMNDPASVNGWGERCNPGQPPGPWNGPRTRLTLHNSGVAFHPLYNSVEWSCGCR